MKHLKWTLPCVAMVLFAFSNVQAAEEAATKPAAGADSKVVLPRGYWSIMASELKLGDDVRAKIAEKIQPLEAWDKANSAKREELNNKIAAASGEEATKLKEQRQALEQERTKLFEKAKADVMTTVLNPEQRVAWQSAELYNGVSRRFGRLQLTDAQVKQAKELAAPFAKQLQEAKDTPDKANEIRAAYVKEISTKVLTDEQRKKLESMPERQGGDRPAMGDRPGRGDRGAGQGDRPARGERGRRGADRQSPAAE